MVPDSAKRAFGSGEIFILLTAILLHDVGRILVEPRPLGTPPPADERCPLAPETKCQEHDGVHHACMSRHLITTLWPMLGLPDEHMANYCGLLAFWHRLAEPPFTDPLCTPAKGSSRAHWDISLDPYGSIRMPLLAAILRIADETENCWTRAVRQHWYDAFIKNDHDPDRLKKAFRRGIEDVEFSHRAGCIVMHVPGYDASDARAVKSFLHDLGRTFEKTRQLVRGVGSSACARRCRLSVRVHRERRPSPGGTAGERGPVQRVMPRRSAGGRQPQGSAVPGERKRGPLP